MSSLSTPITSRQFAEAVHSLPLANLHFKAAEIRNSIAHLESSNQQLQPIADNGDLDCREAIEENAVVMKRMEERVLLLKNEVEGRGFKWGEDEPGQLNIQTNGHEEAGFTRPTTLTAPATEQGTGPSGGSLGDEELARRLRERMEEDEGVDADGVHL
jgi:hypothetical protein